VRQRYDGNRAALSQARRIVRQAAHILASGTYLAGPRGFADVRAFDHGGSGQPDGGRIGGGDRLRSLQYRG
jgi:hypothetical protein